MSDHSFVIAHYKYLDDIVGAVKKLRELNVDTYRTFSPFPCHELEDEVYLDKPRSPVRFFTLLGGLTGCLGAFLMTCFMSVDYPLRVSAKPLISIPAFVVIGFECTILIGGIITMLSMFHFSRLPNLLYWPDYRPNFSEGTFGLAVKVKEGDANAIKAALEKSGADKIEVQYAR